MENNYLGHVGVIPPGVSISAIRGSAFFTCFAGMETVVSIDWLVNATVLPDSGVNFSIEFVSEPPVFSILRLNNLTINFNNTRIGCVVLYSSGDLQAAPESSLLVLQGLKHSN